MSAHTLTTRFLPSSLRPKRGAERRRAKREPLDVPAELFRCPSSSRSAPVKVAVRDISATGVGVISDEPLPVGQKYVVKETTTIAKQKSVLYTVVRAERVPLTASAAEPAPQRYSIGLHASHLIEAQKGFMHSGDGDARSVVSVNGMAKLLLLALIFGGLAAAWTLL